MGASVGVSYETSKKFVYSSGIDFLMTAGSYTAMSDYLYNGGLTAAFHFVNATLSAPPFLVEFVDVGVTNVDLSFQDRIVTKHQTDKSGLSTARCANDGYYLTVRNVNVHIVYGLAQSMWVILEHDVLDVDALVLVLNGS